MPFFAPGLPMPEMGHKELLHFADNLTRRWVRLCILWYVCGLATGLVAAAWFAKARGIW